MNLLKNKIFIFIFLLVASFAFYGRVNAAVLNIKPPQSEVTVGNIVNVQVTVDTLGKVINNAESVIRFPTDLLEVVSIDKTASIFSLWVENPSFSNGAGQVTFNGGVPNPGFSGGNGNIISITFRTKKTGTASVVFSNSAVRENDGLGTDILSNKLGSTITIVNSLDNNQTQKSSAFVVTSLSHPSQNSWYNKGEVYLTWTLPKNATAVKTLLGDSPNSNPTVYYSSPITSKNIENVEDGTWYFHVNYLANGVWSKTEHYRLQIDTVSPTDLRVENRKDDAGKVILDMKAGDTLSGINHFTVVVNSDKPIVVKSDINGEASMEVPFSSSGEHTLTVSAFDKAGNKVETKTTIIADNVPGLRIDSYPAKIKVNESIEISGTAPYPYASLRVSLKNDDNVVQTYKIKSNSYSKFNFISQPISIEGNYALWVDMLRDNEEISLSSQKVTVSVETPLLLQIGSYTIGLMKVLIPAVILLIIFLLIVLYGWYKFFGLYRKVKKESREAEKMLSKSFDILRKDLKEHIVKLKKVESSRKLTTEETEFLEHFKEALSEAEDAITKEVQDISNSSR